MKKLVAILMSGMLFADDIPPIEGEIHSFLEVAPLEKTSTDESEIQGVYETDEPIEQVISYVKGDYIILDKGLVLTANESEYLQLFDEDDDVLFFKNFWRVCSFAQFDPSRSDVQRGWKSC